MNSPNILTGSNYNNDGALGTDSIALGNSAAVSAAGTAGQFSIAIGTLAKATGQQSVVIGWDAGNFSTNTDGSTFVGSLAGYGVNGSTNLAMGGSAAGSLVGKQNTAVGASNALADSKGTQNSAFGQAAGYKTIGDLNTSLGSQTGQYVTGSNNTAVGQMAGSGVTGNGNIAVGYSANFGGYAANLYKMNNAIAIGSADLYGTYALGNNAIAIGTDAQTGQVDSVVIGHNAGLYSGAGFAAGTANTAVGTNSGMDTVGDNNVAVGKSSGNIVTGKSNIAIGDVAGGNVTADSTVSIGTSATASASNAIAMGTGAQASGKSSISIGTGNVVSGDNSGAIGDPTTITGSGTFTMGNNNGIVAANNSGAFGNNNNITGALEAVRVIGNSNTVSANGAMVMGNNATVSAINGVALGNSTNVNVADGVALGSNSVASTTAGVAGYDWSTGVASSNKTPTWVSTLAAVSVGDGTTATRQITGVAAGFEDTDAVNVAQLKAVTASSTIHYYSVNSTNIAAGSNYANDGATGVDALAAGVGASAQGDNSVAAGAATAIGTNSVAIGNAMANNSAAVAINGTATGSQATAINGNANGTASVAIGGVSSGLSSAVGEGAVAIGWAARAQADNATALGMNSSATASGATGLGGGHAEVTNAVAIGTGATASISEGDVALGAGSVTAAANPTATGTMNGVIYDYAGIAPTSVVSVGSAGAERQITNVAAGQVSATSTDAINGSQLYATNTAIKAATTHYYSVNDNAVTTGGNYNNDGATGVNALAAGVSASAVGASSVAMGDTATVALASKNGVAIGLNATSNAVNGVALGATSVASVAGGATGYNPTSATAADIKNIQDTNSTTLGAVSVGTGAVGGNRQIVNVAAGTENSDAVNVAQLKAVSAAVAAGAVHDYSVNSTTPSTDTNYTNGGATGVNALAAGVSASATTLNGVAMGTLAVADMANSVAIGNESKTTVAGVTTGGAGVVNTATVQSKVATLNVDGTVTYTTTPFTYSGFAASTAAGGVFSVGSVGNERRVQNVAAGLITADSTDAINGSQLFAVVSGINTNVNTIVNNASNHFYSINGTSADGNYANNGATGTNALAAGVAATAAGTSATAVGNGATAAGNNSVAVGGATVTTAAISGVAIGNKASTTVAGGVAMGEGSVSSTAVVVGYVPTGATTAQADAIKLTQSTTGAVAVGDSANGVYRQITGVAAGSADSDAVNVAQLKANVATAVGSVSMNFADNSGDSVSVANGGTLVIKGAAATAGTYTGANLKTVTDTATGAINIQMADNPEFISVKTGNTTINNNGLSIENGPSVTSTGINANNTLITNVAPGVAGTDAVNVNQLNNLSANINNQITSVGNIANAGVAQAIAAAGLPQAYLPGKSMVAISGGTYEGEAGYAIGVSSISDNGKWVIKASGSGNSRGKYGASIGAGYQW